MTTFHRLRRNHHAAEALCYREPKKLLVSYTSDR